MLSSPAALAYDWERLLWVPKPIVVVPSMPPVMLARVSLQGVQSMHLEPGLLKLKGDEWLRGIAILNPSPQDCAVSIYIQNGEIAACGDGDPVTVHLNTTKGIRSFRSS